MMTDRGYNVKYVHEDRKWYAEKEDTKVDFSSQNEFNFWEISQEKAFEMKSELNKVTKTNLSEMEPGDIYIQKCKNCGKLFKIGFEELMWYNGQGFPVPKSCWMCRRMKKWAKNNSSMYRFH